MVRSISTSLKEYQAALSAYEQLPKLFICHEKYSETDHNVVVWSQPMHTAHDIYPSIFLASFSDDEEAFIWAEVTMNARKEDIKYAYADYTRLVF